MMINNNDELLKLTLRIQQETASKMGDLTDAVQSLVITEAQRAERERAQAKVNNELLDHIKYAKPILSKAESTQKTSDAVKVPIITALLFAMLVAAGVNLKP